jgi:hypothetical protein
MPDALLAALSAISRVLRVKLPGFWPRQGEHRLSSAISAD